MQNGSNYQLNAKSHPITTIQILITPNPRISNPVQNPLIAAESQLHLSSGLLVLKAVKPALNIAMLDIPY